MFSSWHSIGLCRESAAFSFSGIEHHHLTTTKLGGNYCGIYQTTYWWCLEPRYVGINCSLVILLV